VSLHADAVAVLSDWTAPGAEQERLRRGYLRHLGHHPHATSRDCVPDHLTASALVVSADRGRVLLTLHARIGRWLQTGGHCEDDRTLAAAALREATEESGIPGLVIDPVPVLLSRHQVPCGPVRPASHLDVQHVCVAPEAAVSVRSEESLELAWFGVDALPDDTDDSVRSLVHASLMRLGHTASDGAPASSSHGSPAAADTPSR
jgi:8-oxo-dGTP pyrophosphatase MutT (NUDIX family)